MKKIHHQAGGSAGFHKALFLSSNIGKTDQKENKTSQNPYHGGGSAFYDFFLSQNTIFFFFQRMASLIMMSKTIFSKKSSWGHHLQDLWMMLSDRICDLWPKISSEIILGTTKILSLHSSHIYIQFSFIFLIIASAIDNQFINAFSFNKWLNRSGVQS